MVELLNGFLIINAIVLVVFVLLQPPKSDNAAGTMSGASVAVFAQTKERGAELVFKRLTIVFGTTFMVIPIIIALLSK